MRLPTGFHLTRTLITPVILLSIIAITGSCTFFSRSNRPDNDLLSNVRTLAGFDREFVEPFGVAVRGNKIFVSDGDRGTISRVSLDGSVEVFISGLTTPSSIAFASNGDLIVADTGSNTVKRIGTDRRVTIVAGIEGKKGFCDGDVSTAMFNGPIGVAIGANDIIYVSDTYNDRIRVIKDGIVTTLAGGIQGFADGIGTSARFDTPLGIAVWSGSLLVADSRNRRIRVVADDGFTWTLTGSDATELRDGSLGTGSLLCPTAIAVYNGAVFIADGNAIRAIGRRVFPILQTLSSGRRGLVDGESRQARFNRPSGLAVTSEGKLVVADSDNRLVRIVSDENDIGNEITSEQKRVLHYSANEFRNLQPPRWPYDPPDAKREIAGTLGEVRGEVSSADTPAWFHNGLDVAGSYGETARFVRSETVLETMTVENFGGQRELIRLPTMGYIHIRLGRDQGDRAFNDDRFQFQRNDQGKPVGLRIARGTRFNAGEAIGTLNSLNHVHLIAGPSGAEMNALDALVLPGISDSISPVIEDVLFFTEDWHRVETEKASQRIRVAGKIRIIVCAYDRMDGNADRRRLGVYRLGYRVSRVGEAAQTDVRWMLNFARMPSNEAVRTAYANGSKSGPTGETIFNYIVSNHVDGEEYGEEFLNTDALGPGVYNLNLAVEDYFGNSAERNAQFEVIR